MAANEVPGRPSKRVKTETWAKRMFGSPNVKLIIGPDAIERIVPEAVLCDSSQYFRAALTGAFEERHTKIVTIEDANIDTVDILLHFMAEKHLHLDLYLTAASKTLKLLVDVAVLADRLSVSGIDVCVEEKVFDLMEEGLGDVTSDDIKGIQLLPRCHPVRSLYCMLVAREILTDHDTYALHTGDHKLIDECHPFSAEVLHAVVELERRVRGPIVKARNSAWGAYEVVVLKMRLKAKKPACSPTAIPSRT